MSAEALFTKGGFRVLDKPSTETDHQTIGYVWVEENPQGQLQRWVLGSLLGASQGGIASYVFEPWQGAPATLQAWIDAVEGLWPAGGGIYVVAQSRIVLPLMTETGAVFPEPRFDYPRHETVADHLAARLPPATGTTVSGPPVVTTTTTTTTTGGHPGFVKDLADKLRPNGQVVIPLFEINQRETEQQIWNPRGFGGGFVVGIDVELDEQAFFEGDELFLLRSEYTQGGASTATQWHETPSKDVIDLPSLRKYIEERWKVDYRYEATACSYCLGVKAPPVWFR